MYSKTRLYEVGLFLRGEKDIRNGFVRRKRLLEFCLEGILGYFCERKITSYGFVCKKSVLVFCLKGILGLSINVIVKVLEDRYSVTSSFSFDFFLFSMLDNC